MALTLWTSKLGSEQGRLIPVGFNPPQGDYAFVLGSDAPGRIHAIAATDYHQVSQTAAFTGGVTTLRFRARTRSPVQVPYLVFVNNANPGLYRVTINGTDHDYTADGSDSTTTICNGLSEAIKAGSEPVGTRIVGRASSFQITANDYRVPFTVATTGDLTPVQMAWLVRCLVDGAVRFEQDLRSGRGARERMDGGALIRNEEQAGGNHTIAFRLTLSPTLPSVAQVEAELPAFYVDNVTIEP